MSNLNHNIAFIENLQVVESVDIRLDILNQISSDNLQVIEFIDTSLDVLNKSFFDNLQVTETVGITFILCIDIHIASEIVIDLDFDLTDRELLYMQGLVGDKVAQRRQTVARFHFGMQYKIRDIAKTMGVSKSQVSRDIDHVRGDMLKVIKKDLRSNKKVLGHMIELIYQVNHQINVIWDKYSQLEADSSVLRAGLREAYEARRRDPTAPATNISSLAEASRAVLAIHDRQQGYLSLLSQQTKRMLEIWDKFGLCGEEAINLVLSGGVDIEAKVQEVRTTIVKLVSIVKAEVIDQNTAQRIFGRMVKEIKVDGFTRSDIANRAGPYLSEGDSSLIE